MVICAQRLWGSDWNNPVPSSRHLNSILLIPRLNKTIITNYEVQCTLVEANEEFGHMMQWLQVHDHESQRSCSELQSPNLDVAPKKLFNKAVQKIYTSMWCMNFWVRTKYLFNNGLHQWQSKYKQFVFESMWMFMQYLKNFHCGVCWDDYSTKTQNFGAVLLTATSSWNQTVAD